MLPKNISYLWQGLGDHVEAEYARTGRVVPAVRVRVFYCFAEDLYIAECNAVFNAKQWGGSHLNAKLGDHSGTTGASGWWYWICLELSWSECLPPAAAAAMPLGAKKKRRLS